MAHFLLVAGIRLLEFIFFAGLVGSALVVILSGIEDVGEAFSKGEQHGPEDETRLPTGARELQTS